MQKGSWVGCADERREGLVKLLREHEWKINEELWRHSEGLIEH